VVHEAFENLLMKISRSVFVATKIETYIAVPWSIWTASFVAERRTQEAVRFTHPLSSLN